MIRKFDTIIIKDTAESNGNGRSKFILTSCFVDVEDVCFAFPIEVEGYQNCYTLNFKSRPDTIIIVNVNDASFIDPMNAFLGVINAGYSVVNAYYVFDEMGTMDDLNEAIHTLQERLDRTEAMVP